MLPVRTDPSHRLIQLRWVASACVLAVLLATGPLFALLPGSWPPYAVVAVLVLWNSILTWRGRRGLAPQSAGSQLAFDLLLLGALLALTGGLMNPFSIFIVVQVVLAAILAPALAIPVASLAALLLLLLAGLGANESLPHSGTAATAFPTGASLQWGLAFALLITCAIATPFALRIMNDLRSREAEAARYHAEAEREKLRLEAAITAVGAGLLMTDSRGITLWHNSEAHSILPELAVGARLTVRGSPWPENHLLQQAGHAETQIEARATDGRVRHFSLAGRRTRTPQGDAQWVVVATDVTARRAAERQLASTEKLAALGRLAAGMAHEINTPLASVRLLAQECSEEISAGGHDRCGHLEQCSTRLQEIRGETERISGLVRRFLDLAHPGSSTQESVDLPALVQEAVQLVTLRKAALRERISVQVTDPVPPLWTARDQLLQVLLNGLDNAVDATAANAGAIRISVSSGNGMVQVLIEDEGHGVEQHDLPRLFEPFFTTKSQGQGTGLGLYVSFEIMQNLGGRLSLEPRTPGACLRLELPVTERP